MESVVVTPRSLTQSGHPQLERIKQAGYEIVFPSPGAQPTAQQLAASLKDAVGYLAGVEKISAEVLDGAKNLKVISRNGVGTDNVDMNKALSMGIRVCRAEGANARGVAELAFGHILAGVRHISAASAELKAGHWSRAKGFELEGKVLGLVGCGKIGKLVARFALAFDMKVVAYDPYPDLKFAPSPDFSYADFLTVFGQADVLSLHAPPASDGKPLIDSSVLSRMKKGAVIVNTAREGLVDKSAMKAALESGQISSYSTDAFDKEPPDDWELVKCPGVIATPHLGGFTEESVNRATEVAVDNLLKELKEVGA